MKTKLILALTSVIYFSCENSDVSPTDTLSTRIIGDWLLISEKQKMNSYLVTEDDNGFMSYWGGTGIGWVGSIKLNTNGTANMNHHGRDLPANGTWKVENKTITFFTEIEYVGLILRDTFKFEIAVDENQRLILENDKLLLKHKKLD